MTRSVVVRRLLSICIPLILGYLIGLARFGCRHEYSCAVLTTECELIDEGFGQKMGMLSKGSVLYYPNITDMGVTDPGDDILYKVYVHLPDALHRNVRFLGSSSDAPYDGPRVCPILGLKPVPPLK